MAKPVSPTVTSCSKHGTFESDCSKLTVKILSDHCAGNSDPQQVKALPGPGQESAVETSVTRRTSAVTDAVNRKESSPQESFSTTKKSVGHKSADRTNTQRQKLKKSKVPVRFQERTSKGFSKTINAFDQEKSERAHTRPITRRSTGTHEAQAAATQKTVEASSKDARPRSINTTNSILSGKVDLHKINPERILRVLAHSNFNLPELDADWLKSVSSRDWTNVDLSEWSTIVQVMKHLEENSAAAPLDANSPANSSPHQTESLAKQLSQLVHEAVSHHTQVRGNMFAKVSFSTVSHSTVQNSPWMSSSRSGATANPRM